MQRKVGYIASSVSGEKATTALAMSVGHMALVPSHEVGAAPAGLPPARRPGARAATWLLPEREKGGLQQGHVIPSWHKVTL